MPKETLHYTNGEVTVVWKPKQCIHSTICWKGLVDVFNPRARPWVRMEGAESDRIIAQVEKCPSGALSYFRNEAGPIAEQTEAALPASLKVEVTVDGPYLIKSECQIAYEDGRVETKTGVVALCRCGSSQNKPYCDGSHGRIGFRG